MRGRKRHKKALRDIVPFTDALQPLSAAPRALHDLIAPLSDAAATTLARLIGSWFAPPDAPSAP